MTTETYLNPTTTEISVRHEGTVVATICHERMGAGWGWVLHLLPGQTNRPHPLHVMNGTYATRARTEAEAREVVKDAAHALVTMLDRQAQAVQAFTRALDAATADRQPTLPLGEHDPLDDRQPLMDHEAEYVDLRVAIEKANAPKADRP